MTATAKKTTTKKTKATEAPAAAAVKNLPAVTAAAELVTVENLTPAQIFTTEKITDLLNVVKGKIDNFKGDPTTEDGRAEIVSFAFAVTKSKTLIEKIGDEYAKFLKAEPVRVDAERKRWKETLDVWAKEVRAPVTAIEAAEKDRKDQHQAYLDKIGQAITFTSQPVASNVAERIKWVSDQRARQWEEFANLAESTINGVLESLTETHAKAVQAEKDAAELVALRQKEADRLEAERIQKIKDDAIAEAERKRSLDNEPRTVGEVLNSLPPVTPAPQAAQPSSILTTLSGEVVRTPEQENKARVHRETLASLMAFGTTEAGAKNLITAIAKGLIANVYIEYGA